MRNMKIISFVLIFIIIIPLFNSHQNNNEVYHNNENDFYIPLKVMSINISSRDLIYRDTIRIIGNQDLFDFAQDNNLNGSGTKEDPIMIINYSIDATDKGTGIHIENTDLYCKISNCIVSNASESTNYENHGIHLLNVRNIIIENSISYGNAENGIFISSSRNNTIINSTCFDNGEVGINIYGNSHYNEIKSNIIFDNYESGVKVSEFWKEPSPSNNKILNNTIENHHSFYHSNGISIFSGEKCTILGNHIYDNLRGIHLSEGSGHLLSNNSLYNDNEDIVLTTSNRNYINKNEIMDSLYLTATSAENVIEQNHFTGVVVLMDSKDNLITNNLFEFNSQVPLFFENSIGDKVYNNSFIMKNIDHRVGDQNVPDDVWNSPNDTGNYWSTWIAPDENMDGIVDVPFELSYFNSKDNYPLTNSTFNSFFNSCILKLEQSDDRINLTWSYQSQNDEKIIKENLLFRKRENDEFKMIAEIDGERTHYIDENLDFNTEYYYYIIMKSNMSISDPSNIVKAMIEKELNKPGFPTNTIVQGGNKFVEMSWDPPIDNGGAEILNFNVYRNTSGNDPEMFISIPANNLFFNDTDVINGVGYLYWISAVNSEGESEMAGPFNATPRGPPTAPLNVTIQEGPSLLNISWDSPISDGGYPIRSYWIYRNESGQYILHGETNETFFMDLWANPGVNYSYYIVAVNEYGESPQSLLLWGISFGAPPPPLPIVVGRYDSAVNLNWTMRISYLENYEISQVRIYRNNTFLIEVPVENGYFNDTRLVNGIEYTYQVSSVNIIGEGERSQNIAAIPGWSPSAPRNLKTWSNSTMVMISWDPPEFERGFPVDMYILYRQTDNNRWINLMNVTASSNPHWNDIYVEKGKTYTYKVVALNQRGDSPEAGPIAATVPFGDPPERPVLDNIDLTDKNMIEITWESQSSDDISYSLYRRIGEDGNFSLLNTTTDSQYIDTPSLFNITYYYLLISTNEFGDSLESDIISIFVPSLEHDEEEPEGNETDDNKFQLIPVVTIAVSAIAIVIIILIITRGKEEDEDQIQLEEQNTTINKGDTED